jgi:hypothetical protein
MLPVETKKKPREATGLKLDERYENDPTGQGPEPQRLSQVPAWIATQAYSGWRVQSLM